MFCYSCRHFSLPGFDNGSEEAFAKTGFRRWKKAHGQDGGILNHTVSQCHKRSDMAWIDYEQYKAKNTSMEQVFQRKVQENRHYIKEVILTTAAQNIAQRGHRERDDAINPGNVKKFLKLIANPVVNNRVATGPKNEKYISAAIQHEVIDTFIRIVLEVAEMKCHYFSIQGDESKDVRKTEQLSSVIRFFNETSMSIEECLITFIALAQLDGI